MNDFALDINDTLVWRSDRVAAEALPLAAAQGLCDAATELRAPITGGSVFGTLLNDSLALAELGDAVHAAPYKAPPKAPILYIKPANTQVGHGAPIPVPAGAEGLWAGAALGVVIGKTACRVTAADAMAHIAGYTVVTDFSVPHDSFYRPALPCKVRDRSCAIGPWVRAQQQVTNPDNLAIRVEVDGKVCLEATTATLIRSVATLLCDVSEFMTLAPGDILLAGVPAGIPVVTAGQTVAVEIDQVGRLENRLVTATEFYQPMSQSGETL